MLFPLLVLTGIYHYWKYIFVLSRGFFANGRLGAPPKASARKVELGKEVVAAAGDEPQALPYKVLRDNFVRAYLGKPQRISGNSALHVDLRAFYFASAEYHLHTGYVGIEASWNMEMN